MTKTAEDLEQRTAQQIAENTQLQDFYAWQYDRKQKEAESERHLEASLAEEKTGSKMNGWLLILTKAKATLKNLLGDA